MKTVSAIRKVVTIALVVIVALFSLQKEMAVFAVGIGVDIPVQGFTCGNPDGETDAEKACCPLPDPNHPYAHGDVSIFGNGTPFQAAPKKKSIWGTITGAAGAIIKFDKNLFGLITGNPSGFVKDFITLVFKYGAPAAEKIVKTQVDHSVSQYTDVTQNAIDQTNSVDIQCQPGSYADDVTQAGKCVCKPFGNQAGIPQAERTDWNKWIASNIPADRQYAMAQVLGQSSDPSNSNFAKLCDLIPDTFKRSQCMHQYKATAPKFIYGCSKIKDPVERSKCEDCTVAGQAAYDPNNDGENIAGVWTGIGCVPADLGKFVSNKFLPFALGIGGAAAMLVLMYASYLYMTSRGNPEKLKQAKDYMNSGLIGLLLIIFGVFLLQLLGITILRIPGFS